MNIEDLIPGQKVSYRPTLTAPCGYLSATYIGESRQEPGRVIIHCEGRNRTVGIANLFPHIWMRKGEVFQRFLPDSFQARRCAWKGCGKPVLHAELKWDSQYLPGQQWFNFQAWRHEDGTGLHMDAGFPLESCKPIGKCPDCEKEYPDSHCPRCHTNITAKELRPGTLGGRRWGACFTEGCGSRPRPGIQRWETR